MYVVTNFVFNTLGLWVTKHAGAVLNSITYALLVPLTTVVFSLPLLGPYQESVHMATLVGLATVLVGFGLWRSAEGRVAASAAAAAAATPTAGEERAPLSLVPSRENQAVPSSFQERVVGLGLAHRQAAAIERVWAQFPAHAREVDELAGAGVPLAERRGAPFD